MSSREAYRLWAGSYALQPENVFLAVESEIFASFLEGIQLSDKVVLDVGCGTGRHWGALLACGPRSLDGVDSSPEMLAQLRASFPGAAAHLRTGMRLDEFVDGSVDLVVSTLMLGHEADADGEVREWTRVLRVGGEILVTDFHPDAFLAGMRRTFSHAGRSFEVEHHALTLDSLRSSFRRNNLEIVRFEERRLDAALRERFERLDYVKGYEKGFGAPLAYGFRLQKAG